MKKTLFTFGLLLAVGISIFSVKSDYLGSPSGIFGGFISTNSEGAQTEIHFPFITKTATYGGWNDGTNDLDFELLESDNGYSYKFQTYTNPVSSNHIVRFFEMEAAISQRLTSSELSWATTGEISASAFNSTDVYATFLNASDSVRVNGTKVLGDRAEAIGNATDETDVVTKFNSLLEALREHGLIASSP